MYLFLQSLKESKDNIESRRYLKRTAERVRYDAQSNTMGKLKMLDNLNQYLSVSFTAQTACSVIHAPCQLASVSIRPAVTTIERIPRFYVYIRHWRIAPGVGRKTTAHMQPVILWPHFYCQVLYLSIL